MAKKVAPQNKAVLAKLKKAGIATAHKKHKDDETVISEGMSLPPGIDNGVAQLVEAGLFEYTEGQKGPKGGAYARFTGIIKEPTEKDGVTCKGKRTSIFIPLHDTPQSQKKPKMEDHYADLLNELRKFGIDTSELEVDDIAEKLEELVEEGPHFKFRTWQGQATKQFPNPRVNETWLGVVDHDDEEDPDAEVVEEDDDDAEEEEAPKAKTGGKKRPPVDEEEEDADDEEEEADDEEDAEEVDYLALGKAADKGDDDAIESLTAAASENDLDPDDYPDSWLSLGKAIKAAVESGGEEEEEDDEEDAEPEPPVEGEVRMYDGTEVIVGKVNVKKKTADVTDAENDDEYKNVPWEELTEA